MRAAERYRWRKFLHRNCCQVAVLVRIAASVVSAGTERASVAICQENFVAEGHVAAGPGSRSHQQSQREGILSAIHAVRSRLDQPQPPGYSSAGTVVAVGEGVIDLQTGDRVACAGAGFAVHAEIACVPRLLVARIPESPLAGDGSFRRSCIRHAGGGRAPWGSYIARRRLGISSL